MADLKFAEISVALPVDGLFHYAIPPHLTEKVDAGKRVKINFAGRFMAGYVVGITGESPVKDVKEIIDVIDSNPVFNNEMYKLAQWISEYYCCSIGEALQAAVPLGIKENISHPSRRKKITEELYSDNDHFISAYPKAEDLKLNTYQEKALQEINGAISGKRHETFLLHGVTGSGKTEVYLRAIEKALEAGGSSIVLVPEIALTPQTVGRFISRFGKMIAIHHSHLTESMRKDEWARIRSGEARIVIGARSAIFCPIKNLLLVVVDEEHETSYKQGDVPRYHARDVAVMRASISNAVVVLGSATPSLESYHKSEEGKYRLIQLPERVDGKLLPDVEIVDSRSEMAERKGKYIISRQLEYAIKKTLDGNEQALLLLNRRGFSTLISCKRCGEPIKCRKCDISLVYHRDKEKLICHYCNYEIEPPSICPFCNSEYVAYHGLGTQKVVAELARIFPEAKVARLDTDATRKRGTHHRVLKEFANGNIDILVGTQMIAKGLDFPRVRVVGVVSADTALNLPDFRSGERTFSLLTQVAGRSGRGGSKGEVVIQTCAPEHYAVAASVHQDYEKFYRLEIISRKELALPPFVRMANIILRGKNEKNVISLSDELFAKLNEAAKDREVTVLGPAPMPIPRLKGFYRWHITLKMEDGFQLTGFLKEVLRGVKRHGGIYIAIDVDPVSIL
ncbi:MAG: primosomal protein N' [Candidatus Omnitrophica bacterium]|nr:primosomal protein N' [Candidatus Omnitrophota bacterium]